MLKQELRKTTDHKMYGPWFYFFLVFFIVIWIPPVIAVFRLKSITSDFPSIARNEIYSWYSPISYPYHYYFDIRSCFPFVLDIMCTDCETR